MISKNLKTTVGLYGPNLGFEAKYVYTCYLCSTGAMDLLCSGINNGIIKMIGRWRSEEMLRYFHVQAEPLMSNFSRIMLTHGNYYFLLH